MILPWIHSGQRPEEAKRTLAAGQSTAAIHARVALLTAQVYQELRRLEEVLDEAGPEETGHA